MGNESKASTLWTCLSLAVATAMVSMVCLTGCDLSIFNGGTNSTPIITNATPTNATPTNVPPVTNTPPVTNALAWRGVMFTPATPGLPNNNGVRSQLDYRGIHNQSGEFAQRMDMPVCIQRWGGNTLIYIRGEFDRNNPVLDMVLNGRRHPGDGHYFPIKTPTATAGEVDFAMWMKQTYGIDKHVCWVWNDNTSVPFTASVVAEAVAAYDGCRLGLENVAFGTCLESDENMSADLVVSACGWIHAASPASPVIVGSANEGFLQQVGSRVPYAHLWLEQSSNPVKAPRAPLAPGALRQSRAPRAPLTQSTFPAYLAACKRLADKFGCDRVIPGEWWAATPADMSSMTAQLRAAGFKFLGSGKYQ